MALDQPRLRRRLLDHGRRQSVGGLRGLLQGLGRLQVQLHDEPADHRLVPIEFRMATHPRRCVDLPVSPRDRGLPLSVERVLGDGRYIRPAGHRTTCGNAPTGCLADVPMSTRTSLTEKFMYIGLGTILIICLIVYFVRRV